MVTLVKQSVTETRKRVVVEELRNGAQTASQLALSLHWTPANAKEVLLALIDDGDVVVVGMSSKGIAKRGNNGRIYSLAGMAETERTRLTGAKRMTSGSGVIAATITHGRGYRWGAGY